MIGSPVDVNTVWRKDFDTKGRGLTVNQASSSHHKKTHEARMKVETVTYLNTKIQIQILFKVGKVLQDVTLAMYSYLPTNIWFNAYLALKLDHYL